VIVVVEVVVVVVVVVLVVLLVVVVGKGQVLPIWSVMTRRSLQLHCITSLF